MSGVAIIRALLVAHAPLRAIVPNETEIRAGVLPQGSVVPAVSVHSIGDTEEPTVARLGRPMLRERVQVTALARDYVTMKKLVKATALGRGVHTGTVLGYEVRSVLPLGTNPEIPPGDEKIYEQSRDFMVTFVEAN